MHCSSRDARLRFSAHSETQEAVVRVFPGSVERTGRVHVANEIMRIIGELDATDFQSSVRITHREMLKLGAELSSILRSVHTRCAMMKTTLLVHKLRSHIHLAPRNSFGSDDGEAIETHLECVQDDQRPRVSRYRKLHKARSLPEHTRYFEKAPLLGLDASSLRSCGLCEELLDNPSSTQAVTIFRSNSRTETHTNSV